MEVGGCMSYRLLLSITSTSSNLGMALLPGKSLNTITEEEQTGPKHNLLRVIDFDSSLRTENTF